jgi:hypothetical protein
MVVHACNPIHSGGSDEEDYSFRIAALIELLLFLLGKIVRLHLKQ